ncbi:PLC-like phosphodiesterase [Venturia nashicola]|uniref:Altered inheritance of mitochondria protein 6 n=1 Tax=Venturia nashicola TaxID=86259 RepID=A0A4Z1NWJ9_9PEZI|nr:PLC-like phosphodiesterase [Venturia nashicola]
MNPPAKLDSWENDVETVAGQSSAESESESEAFLDQKKTFVSVHAMDRIGDWDEGDCPVSRRKPFWEKWSVWRSSSRRCKHDRRSKREYNENSRPIRKRRTSTCTIFLAFLTILLALFGLYNVVTILVGLGPLIWDPDFDQFFPNWGKQGQPGEGLSGYPTDFTRDILPLPCHSHNDYWRRIPLFSAVHYGCTGVEADVWLFSEELLVGHNTAALSKNRTFRSLYVDPLVKVLDDQNPSTEYNKHSKNIRGVFDADPSQTLVLLVDFKTDGPTLFPFVESQLSALREKNYLTYFDGKSIIKGAVTVVGTGNAPFQLLTANTTYRDIFFDAPLDKLTPTSIPSGSPTGGLPLPLPGISATGGGQGSVGVTPSTNFNQENSYYASVNFGRSIGFPWRGHLSPKQRHKLRAQIKAAHAKGLKARYWNTPAWPIGVRNHVWKVLMDEGADMLNVDDLRGASRVDWRRKKERG